MYHELVPQQLLDLDEEAQKHPDLLEKLSVHPPNEMHIRCAGIAAFCGVVLDGAYTEDDINKLAEILTNKLRSRRTGIILVTK